ncbi:hypothetical protein ABZ721_31590 [Streptomyces sp. NPDC006733]|uniref:hypothetical protein n=1 Tax=Streptomyces sp. NPDC006733 TaxID=3155460 RepID=UPI0033D0AE28
MLLASMNLSSSAYQNGYQSGRLLWVGIAMPVIWKTTKPWRQPKAGDVDDLQLVKLRRTRQRTVMVGLVAVAVVGVALVALSWKTEETGDAATGAPQPELTTFPQAPPSAAAASKPHTLSVPAVVGDYRLRTGAPAQELNGTKAEKSSDSSRRWFYENPTDHSIVTVVTNRFAQESEPRDAEASIDGVAVMVGTLKAVHASHTLTFPAGPLGGELQCGTPPPSSGYATVCAGGLHDARPVGILRCGRPAPGSDDRFAFPHEQ